jgi:hypothetical protein
MKLFLIEFKLSEITKVILNVDSFSGISHVDVAKLYNTKLSLRHGQSDKQRRHSHYNKEMKPHFKTEITKAVVVYQICM